MMNSQPESGCSTDWCALVAKIRKNDPIGDEELDRVFSAGIRFFLNRSFGPLHLAARERETMLIVKAAIRANDFIPETLASTVRGVVQEQVAKHLDQQSESAAHKTVQSEDVALMTMILNSRCRKDREALVRFYVDRQPRREICAEMQLDEKDFELMKAEVKVRFEEAIARRGNDNPSRKTMGHRDV